MKILYISPENTVGTLSTWKTFHQSKGNQCDFITFYKNPHGFDSGICLNLPMISSHRLYRNIRSLYYKINSTSKNEYLLKEGYPPIWEPNSYFEKLYFSFRDFMWSFKINPIIKKLNLFDYDVYHFEWGLDFYRNCAFVNKIKELDKKIICTYHGQDMRTRGVLKKLDQLSDINFTSELDLLSKHPKLNYMFLPIQVDKQQTIKKTERKIRICHSPTNRYYKGSEKIISVCKKIESEYENVKFILIENMANKDVVKIKEESDILIDQIGDAGGWGYGMNSIEAMSLGVCCMTQMNEKCNNFFQNHPFIKINGKNLKPELINLITNPNKIDYHKKQSLKWIQEKHAVNVVGAKLYLDYQEMLREK